MCKYTSFIVQMLVFVPSFIKSKEEKLCINGISCTKFYNDWFIEEK
jgi:hypothetical protein